MDSWDDCTGDVQAKIIAFDQVASHDEAEREAQLAGAGKPSRPAPSSDTESRPLPKPKGKAKPRATKKGKKPH